MLDYNMIVKKLKRRVYKIKKKSGSNKKNSRIPKEKKRRSKKNNLPRIR